MFRFVDVFVVDVSVSRRFDQLPTKGSTLTHQILFINMVIILQSTYQNGFLQWHFSLSHSPCVLLLKYNLHFTLHRLYIVNIFPTFKHFNPSFSPLMRRIKYRTCLTLRLRDIALYNRQKSLVVCEKLHDGTNFHSLYMPFGDSPGRLFCICRNCQSHHVHYTEFIFLSYGAHACRLGLISITVASKNKSSRSGYNYICI